MLHSTGATLDKLSHISSQCPCVLWFSFFVFNSNRPPPISLLPHARHMNIAPPPSEPVRCTTNTVIQLLDYNRHASSNPSASVWCGAWPPERTNTWTHERTTARTATTDDERRLTSSKQANNKLSQQRALHPPSLTHSLTHSPWQIGHCDNAQYSTHIDKHEFVNNKCILIFMRKLLS